MLRFVRWHGKLGIILPAGIMGQTHLPTCGKTIPEGKYVASGKMSEGGFCTLVCYAEYYRMEIVERAKKVQELAERHRSS
jgi:hypothetical protein